MIRDILVINKAGLPLVALNFGNCHSFKSNPSEFAGLISIIQQYCKTFTGQEINIVEMNKLKIGFYSKKNLQFCIIFDVEDDSTSALNKIEMIAKLFITYYDVKLIKFNGNINLFKDFGDLLITSNIAQKNCGNRNDCNDCPNSDKNLEITEILSANKAKKIFHSLIDV
ncbi:hypothetical protein [Candidatus Lokiarchaeum ossiferum]|uniref:hypothetical protein n=1 Tax=Candidatus Lokiarchaeum ossiferum TaxID=2951803 RepID=UPI00352D0467